MWSGPDAALLQVCVCVCACVHGITKGCNEKGMLVSCARCASICTYVNVNKNTPIARAHALSLLHRCGRCSSHALLETARCQTVRCCR